MTFTRVATGAAAATSIAFGTHQTGDLLMIFGFNTVNTSVITVPSGWNFVHSNGTTGQSRVMAFKYAQNASETSGTWTNATHLMSYIARGTDGPIMIGDYSFAVTSGVTSASYGAIIQQRKRDGTAYVLGAAVTSAIDSTIDSTPPAGMTALVSALDGTRGECALHDTNGGVVSWSTTVAAIGGTAGTVTRYTVELFESLLILGGGAVYQHPGMTGGFRA